MEWSDWEIANRLPNHGFEIGYNACHWYLYARGPCSSISSPIEGCGRSLYICLLQGRYFGDAGSLILFYDGLSLDLQELQDLGIPPYGLMVAWHMPCTGSCVANCIENDPVLPPFMVSMLTQSAVNRSSLPCPCQMVCTVQDNDP